MTFAETLSVYRSFFAAPILGLIFTLTVSLALAADRPSREPVPVVFDTDIGGDIDDTWALALMLASPELDLKLVVTDSHDTMGKAKIAAKFLQAVGRSDIPIGIGKRMPGSAGPQLQWAKDYELDSYPGVIHEDGVGALIDTIMKSKQHVTLIVVGPAPNIEEALKQEPRIIQKSRVVAMSGSVHKGYGGKPTPDAEYNVKDHPSSTAAMYAAGWDVLIAPLDTAGLVRLSGLRYRRVLRSERVLPRTLIDSYRAWAANVRGGSFNPEWQSSTLFDTVAVLLAFRTDLCEIEEVKLQVTLDGYTRRDESGSPVLAALRWKDLGAFEDFLVERLAP